jgi:hypothetical protein
VFRFLLQTMGVALVAGHVISLKLTGVAGQCGVRHSVEFGGEVRLVVGGEPALRSYRVAQQ